MKSIETKILENGEALSAAYKAMDSLIQGLAHPDPETEAQRSRSLYAAQESITRLERERDRLAREAAGQHP